MNLTNEQRGKIHQVVDMIIDLVASRFQLPTIADITAEESQFVSHRPLPALTPPPARIAPAPAKQTRASTPAAGGERTGDVVTMSVPISSGCLRLAINLPGAVVERVGLDGKKASVVVRADRSMVIVSASKGASVYRMNNRYRIELNAKFFGLKEKTPPCPVKYEIHVDGTLMIWLPKWFPDQKEGAAPIRPSVHHRFTEKKKEPVKPTAKREEPRGEVVGRDEDYICSSSDCVESATMQCNRCEELFCPPHWKDHAKHAHNGTTGRRQ